MTDLLDVFPASVAILIENKDAGLVLIPENRLAVDKHFKAGLLCSQGKRGNQNKIMFFLIADKAAAQL